MKNILLFEADCLKGTKDLAINELLKLGNTLEIYKNDNDESIIFSSEENYQKFKSLKRIVNLYYLLCFPAKGPGNLLAIKNISEISLHIQKAIKNSLDFPAKTFRISAAGSESETYKEIIKKISHFTGLSYDKKDGDILIRFRKSLNSKASVWEVLIRLSSRPLSFREWKKNNFNGALNPILANILYDLATPKKGDSMLNVMCGSGTILIEAFFRKKLTRIVGIDNNKEVLTLCEENIKNAKCSDIEIFEMDACNLKFKDNEFNFALLDFPWGENVGDKKDNLKLYTKTLNELRRVVKKGGKIGAISQDIHSLELAIKSCNLSITGRKKVWQGGFFPEIFILE